jgi:hypothetical protein
MQASGGDWQRHGRPPQRSDARVIDATDVSVHERIETHASAFPTGAELAATIVQRYLDCGSVDRTVAMMTVGEMRIRQVLHRCGVAAAAGFDRHSRRTIEAAVAGRVGLEVAMRQTGLSAPSFILGVYCVTHPPITEVAAVVRRERYRIR